jgi:hypothetical protein
MYESSVGSGLLDFDELEPQPATASATSTTGTKQRRIAVNVEPSFFSRNWIRPVPPQKLTPDVTVGDLLVVVYLLLVVVYVAWRWSPSARPRREEPDPLASNVFDSDEFDSGVVSVRRIPRGATPREPAGSS